MADQKPSFDFRTVKTTEPPAVRTAIRAAAVTFWCALVISIFCWLPVMPLPVTLADAALGLALWASLLTWAVLRVLVVVIWTPENRFTLRSLILINIFVGTLLGFVVRGGFRPDAGRLGPPQFWLAALFFAAAVASLILDERRWREMKQRRREDEDDDGPARED